MLETLLNIYKISLIQTMRSTYQEKDRESQTDGNEHIYHTFFTRLETQKNIKKNRSTKLVSPTNKLMTRDTRNSFWTKNERNREI